MNCPCGLNQSYEKCCGIYHDGKAKPDTPEKLMRSRYSAYVNGKIDYIAKTNDPASRDSFDRDAAEEWSKSSEWKGLEIIAAQGDEVEFRAKYVRDGKEHNHHEVSLFKKIEGEWFYIDGKEIYEQIRRTEPKLGRNDPCSCGSGKKFKKCCG